MANSEIQLRQLAENLEQVLWVRDLNSGSLVYVSPAYETVWGRSCESLYANPLSFIESVHPEDRLQVLVAQPHEEHKRITLEYRILRPDGSLRWISSSNFFIEEEDRKPYRLVSFAQDITGQKTVVSALRKTLDRTREQFLLSRKMSLARKPETVLRALMSARELRSAQRATLLFFEHPEEGPARGVEVLAAWQSGPSLPSWMGESTLYEDPELWGLLLPGRPVVFANILNDPHISPGVRELLQAGDVYSLVIFPWVAAGVWLGCLLVFYQQEQNFNKTELRYLKVIVDQASITLYNLQLLKNEESSRHQAERANEIKTRFLAMISHELRTPLTSIKGFTTTLLAEDVIWEPDEQRDFVQTIQQEANRLQELIDHLLDLTRLEAGMLPISPAPSSLQQIIADVLPQFNALHAYLELRLHLPEHLPLIWADARRVAQVLTNILQNAAIYAPDSQEISLSAFTRGNFVQVEVSDQGPGIPAEERKRVFEVFHRGAKDESDSSQGAGLGLTICKRLVEAQGGRIWIKTKPGPGATIAFTLPLAPPPSNPTTSDVAR